MKRTLLFAALFCSAFCFAQQKADTSYKRVFGAFVRYYNTIKPDSIAKLFRGEYGYWTSESLQKQHEEWGKITGFKYVGPFENELDVEGNLMVYFKVSFDKKADIKDNFFEDNPFNGKDIHAGAIALDNKNLIVGCRLFTSSKSVDSLIAQY